MVDGIIIEKGETIDRAIKRARAEYSYRDLDPDAVRRAVERDAGDLFAFANIALRASADEA